MSLPGCAASGLPLSAGAFPDLHAQELPFLGLATSLPEEHDYEARVEGPVPPELRGTLYRATPGLFERSGLRKRTILDGDGMVQSFRFHDRGVHYRNRYVHTEKYLEESAAGEYIYPSFSTQAPGGVLANFWPGSKIRSQAQISVVLWRDRLYAFDESSQPYELDPETLETSGMSLLGLPQGASVFSAHSKIDSRTGEWVHFGLHYGRNVDLHITVFAPSGTLRYHRTVRLPRYVYFHDFLVSARHLIFILQPMGLRLLGFLMGTRSMADCLRWNPGEGNMILVLGRDPLSEPLFFSADACFLWHTINAQEHQGALLADFIGYRNPDHLVGEDPPVFAVMEGRKGRFECPGQVRRYVMDLGSGRLREEMFETANCEWPAINPLHRCHRYRYGYLALARQGDFFWSGIGRCDMDTGKSTDFYFREGLYCTEPLFVPLPGFGYDPGSAGEPGWLLSVVYDSTTRKSFLAVLRADNISEGPLARIHLEHHSPFTMHGFWSGRG